MKQILFFLLLLCQSVFQVSVAVTVEDLYSIEVPVADQTTRLRLDAFREAFQQVVVKVSGSNDALLSQALKRPIQNSARYVKQFTYDSRESENAQDLGSLLFLKIDFNQRLIESLLRDNNIPVWGRERPGNLLVISYDFNETVKLVTGDSAPKLVKMLDDAAGKQGLPILFPLMDLEDISLIQVGDVVSRHIEKIDSMASRYAPDVLVVGQIVGRSGTGWFGDWEVRFDEQLFKWQHEASSQEAIVNQLVKHLARVLALEYALESHVASIQNLMINISGLSGIKQLIAAQKYLQSLTVVDSVRIALIENDVGTFRIRLKNRIEDLQRLIEFGEVLEQEDFPQINTQLADTIHLSYSYIDRGDSN